MLAKLLCTKRKSASAPRCLRCLGATIDIVNSITRTANRSGQGGIFASMFTKGQHRGHGDHWAWRLTGNYCQPTTKRLDRDGCVLHPLTAVGPVRIRAPLAILARTTPDGERWAPHVLGHVARQALRPRRDVPLLDGGHQAVGRLPATRRDQPGDRVRLTRLADQAHQVPLPLTTQEIVGQVLAMLPARSLASLPPTGREQMPRGLVRTMAPRRVEHRAGAPPERLAPDGALEVIQAR